MSTCQFNLSTLKNTRLLAQKIAGELPPRVVLALVGPLGAGKTAFTQAFAQILGIKKTIVSPTFTILQTYNRPKKATLVHIDAYRLKNSRELLALGFADFWNDDNIMVIEWADKIKKLLHGRPICWLKFSWRRSGERVCDLSCPTWPCANE